MVLCNGHPRGHHMRFCAQDQSSPSSLLFLIRRKIQVNTRFAQIFSFFAKTLPVAAQTKGGSWCSCFPGMRPWAIGHFLTSPFRVASECCWVQLLDDLWEDWGRMPKPYQVLFSCTLSPPHSTCPLGWVQNPVLSACLQHQKNHNSKCLSSPSLLQCWFSRTLHYPFPVPPLLSIGWHWVTQ